MTVEAALESLFTFLFKYSPYAFERGTVVLTASWTSAAIGTGMVFLGAFGLWRYRKLGSRASSNDRLLLVGLRASLLAVLLLCLFQPALAVRTTVPQQNFVGVLVDDSRSMRIADGVAPRSEVATGLLGTEGSAAGALGSRLAERYEVRMFGFSEATRRIRGVDDLAFDGSRTDLVTALERARQELGTVPLAGLVLLSDGADNDSTGLSDTLQELADDGVSVFTVGIGEEAFDRDIEIAEVDAPREVLRGSELAVDVVVEHRGFGPIRVPLHVEDEGRIVSTRQVRLDGRGGSTVVQAHFPADDPGPRRFRFRIPAQDGELVSRNNERQVLMGVADRAEPILYFEGEPRYEVKFLRRAVEEDPNLEIVLMQRTAPNRFYQLGGDPDALSGGFPETRATLFEYRGLILGSVEAGFFTRSQRRLIAEFVDRRGGGLLALGGRNSFARGGWVDTRLADVLPVVLETPPASRGHDDREDGVPRARQIRVRPTRFGRSHPLGRLGSGPEEIDALWERLPPLYAVNPIRRTKPGALTLLEGHDDELDSSQVVLAYQRFGRGTAMAFTVFDSWQWQMHHDVPVDDRTHETLWRQLLRWLVTEAPTPVEASPSRSHVAPGRSVELDARVVDDAFLAVNDAVVRATVRGPSGRSRQIDLDWTVDQDGRYRGELVPREEGLHEIVVEARRGDRSLGSATTWIESGALDDEYFDAEMDRERLERIAGATGGRYHTPASAEALVDDLKYADGGSTVLELQPLWNAPGLFLLAIALLGAEWGLRKRRGLP